jgi:hypothetical protein
MRNKFKAALAATAMVATFAVTAPANAAVFYGFFQGKSVADLASLGYAGFTLLNDFSVDAGVTGDYMIHGPFSDSEGAVPAFGSSGNYLSVKGGQEAFISLSTGASAFAFDWGSLDTYNELFGACTGGVCGGGSLFQMIPGVIPSNTLGNGDQFSANTNGLLLVFGTEGEIFTDLKLKSGSNSFEIDNLSIRGAVPEPATWAMMIGGFALAGAAMRRRKAIVSFA